MESSITDLWYRSELAHLAVNVDGRENFSGVDNGSLHDSTRNA